MQTDVIIVGAGPTGLMLAGELRLAGAAVVVVERLGEPAGQSRGLGFTARTMEVFDQRGLLPMFGELQTDVLGHFGGVRFDYSVLATAHFGTRGIPQSQTEAVLEKWATGLGAEIRRGWDLLTMDQDQDSVRVTVGTPEGSREITAEYLVGCDGGQSTVRKIAGFSFPGTDATRRMYIADLVGCGLTPRLLGERHPAGMVMAAPLGRGVDRVIVCEANSEPDRDSQPDFAEVAEAWQRITGEDISHGGADWVSTFSDAARLVTEYRRGRVFVAGDAAHIHLPAGSQGLSTGVQDAMNLGWKLGAVIRGSAPAELLDTYHSERHPVGVRLLMNTRVQGTLFISGTEADPLRELFGELIVYDDVKRHLAGIVSGLDIQYDVGGEQHPLLGRRLPPLVLPDGRQAVELMHPGKGVFLAAGETLLPVVSPWADRIVTAPHPAGSILVRPDGYVAWAGSDAAGLTAALRRWFGPATTPTTRSSK